MRSLFPLWISYVWDVGHFTLNIPMVPSNGHFLEVFCMCSQIKPKKTPLIIPCSAVVSIAPSSGFWWYNKTVVSEPTAVPDAESTAPAYRRYQAVGCHLGPVPTPLGVICLAVANNSCLAEYTTYFHAFFFFFFAANVTHVTITLNTWWRILMTSKTVIVYSDVINNR